jgi:hypothetical protein
MTVTTIVVVLLDGLRGVLAFHFGAAICNQQGAENQD